jgi:GMP synthase-like glutamine amidotransferase
MRSTSAPVLVLQHGELGPSGVFGEWAAARGVESVAHPAWREPLPADPAAYAAVVSLGSDDSTRDETIPWIGAELEFLRRAVTADVPVLGLCFGGQALALALDGAVGPSRPVELAWLPVATEAPDVVGPGPWMTWHYECLAPPAGAEILGRLPSGVAAFRQGRHLGTQFHPEATLEMVDSWVEVAPHELEALGVDPAALHADGERHAPASREQALRLFDAWWAGVRG